MPPTEEVERYFLMHMGFQAMKDRRTKPPPTTTPADKRAPKPSKPPSAKRRKPTPVRLVEYEGSEDEALQEALEASRVETRRGSCHANGAGPSRVSAPRTEVEEDFDEDCWAF